MFVVSLHSPRLHGCISLNLKFLWLIPSLNLYTGDVTLAKASQKSSRGYYLLRVLIQQSVDLKRGLYRFCKKKYNFDIHVFVYNLKKIWIFYIIYIFMLYMNNNRKKYKITFLKLFLWQHSNVSLPTSLFWT